MGKPNYPRGDVPVNFFSVYLTHSNPNIPPLDPIKDEIVGLDYCHRPSVFFTPSTHPLVVAYERTKGNIVKLLNQKIGSKWRLLCPFNVGSMKSKPQPMIVIIYQLSPHVETDDFDIESLLDGLSLSTSGGADFVDRLTLNAIPRMGYLIGIRGDKNAGTLGGFVTLTHDGIVRRGFLTACIDRDVTLANLDSILNNIREQHSEVTARMQERELIGETPHPRFLEWMANYDSYMEKTLPQRAAIERMPHVLGGVKFVSGKQLRGGRVLDWAFVELSEYAEQQCFRPNRLFAITPHFLPSWLIPPQPVMFAQEHSVLGGFGSLSGGICNGPKAYCKWETSRYDSSGKPVDMATEPTEEFIIVTQEAMDHSKRAFCGDGDSGSFVLNRFGDVTGLLWGGVRYQDLGVGLASSMSDVLESIREEVGGPVSIKLPQ
ncbi:uncharacterized protein PGRI_015400 [Penicillium griseofulvum]|uniref:Peptidase S64, Ssy5 n=1 Tax=Penicillium patulum TaxID=5078 RepID=A0A135LFJ4_PENPA|nr:uncharacterized protein PGRI_015400 [Penicillium griseofulvum]KXG47670.1 hypothetical protein PGRI_015400 [Penicillium griseofulvum]